MAAPLREVLNAIFVTYPILPAIPLKYQCESISFSFAFNNLHHFPHSFTPSLLLLFSFPDKPLQINSLASLNICLHRAKWQALRRSCNMNGTRMIMSLIRIQSVLQKGWKVKKNPKLLFCEKWLNISRCFPPQMIMVFISFRLNR